MSVRSMLPRSIERMTRGVTTRSAILVVTALAVAACGSTSTPTTSGAAQGNDLFNPSDFNVSNISWLSANQNASSSPVMGGTLQIEGSTDLSAGADPQGEYETIGFTLERAYARQLLSYPASTNLT